MYRVCRVSASPKRSSYALLQALVLVPTVALVDQQTLRMTQLLHHEMRVHGVSGEDILSGRAATCEWIEQVLSHHVTVATPDIVL